MLKKWGTIKSGPENVNMPLSWNEICKTSAKIKKSLLLRKTMGNVEIIFDSCDKFDCRVQIFSSGMDNFCEKKYEHFDAVIKLV